MSESEASRLRALHEQAILDTPPEAAFDDLAYLAADVCGAPVARIVFVDRDRQWFKAHIGGMDAEYPRSAGFCPLTIEGRELLVVRDAWADPRLRDRAVSVADPPPRFYAGVPLITSEGHALGTICVLDHVPRDLEAWQAGALRLLARLVIRELEVRRARRDLDRRKTEVIGALAGGLAHEFNGLLGHLQRHASLLEARLGTDDPGLAAWRDILEGARRAADLARQMLAVSRHRSSAPQAFDLNDLISRREAEWRALLGDAVRLRLRLHPDLGQVSADPAQIGRALWRLVESARGGLPRGGELSIATERPASGGYLAVSIAADEEVAVAGSQDRPLAPPASIREDATPGDLELSAARGIITQSGGLLEVDDRRGGGAGYRILLPSVTTDQA